MVSDGQRLPSVVDEPTFTGSTLAAAVDGRLVREGRVPIRGGAVDSRRVTPGVAFFALPGERTDGHRFLLDAAVAGAGVLVVREVPDAAALAAIDAAVAAMAAPPPAGGAFGIVVVADPGAALLAAAKAWRSRWTPLVVGVTGSLAKTSTKEQVAEVLSERWLTLRNEGNENNEIGLPLTLLRLGPEHGAAVLEMGLFVPGDIGLLAAIARPSIGVVTAVRGVHLSRAGTLDAIEQGKRELVEALPATGTAVLNLDDPRVAAMRGHTRARFLGYGLDAAADVSADRIVSRGADGMQFRLRLPGAMVDVETPALGRHSVHNALAAAAVGHAAGLDAAAIARGLSRGFRAPHRTALLKTGRWSVLDDSYNAAPDSMIAALELLATLPGRHVAVLGEMLELGDDSVDAHRQVGMTAARLAQRLVVVGAEARPIADGARSAGMAAGAVAAVADRAAALELLLRESRDGDTILVKASRGAELDLLVDPLVRAGDQGARA